MVANLQMHVCGNSDVFDDVSVIWDSYQKLTDLSSGR